MLNLTRGQRYMILVMVSSLVLLLAVLLNYNNAATAGGIITWSDGTTSDIYQVGVDGTGAVQVVTDAADTLLDVDTDGTYLYWAENNSLVINYVGRSNFDGTSPQSDWLDTSTVGKRTWGIALNDTHIYWTDTVSECVFRANIDGTNPITVVDIVADLSIVNPNAQDITLDETSIYWLDGGLDRLYKANLDGTGAQELIDLRTEFNTLYGSTSSMPYGIVVYGSYLYIADGGPDKIFRVGTDGSGFTELIDPDTAIASASYGPYGITTDGTYLYWADPIQDAIYKANLDGTGVITFTRTSDVSSANPRYLAYDLAGANAVTLSGLQNQTSWIVPLAVAGIIVLATVVLWMRKQSELPHSQ